ncbi:MAG: hypothetical protein OXG47_08025 [bacterium]|nr:hypothetical protein [bacterium]
MTTAAALAVALPATGLIVAVVLAFWRSTNARIDEQGCRMDNFNRQLGEVLHALGRLEGRREAEAEARA